MAEHGCCIDGSCNEDTCMGLPDGLTCGDCTHIGRCQAMFGHVPEDTYCDWFPRRFRQRRLRIYVASSWRNELQPTVVETLQGVGFEVYDFRHPTQGDDGFHWSEIDPKWKAWSPERFRESLLHPLAKRGFGLDFAAMGWADVCLLVMPCGRSAHLEAGWFAGFPGKHLVILLEDGEPELMYAMATALCCDLGEAVSWLRTLETILCDGSR